MSTSIKIKRLFTALGTGMLLTVALIVGMPGKAQAADAAPQATQTPVMAEQVAQPQETEQMQSLQAGEPIPSPSVIVDAQVTQPSQAAETQTPVPQEAQQPEPEQIVTTPSLVVMRTDVMSIPSYDGEVVGTLHSGQMVNVYATNVNNEWNAVMAVDGTVQYVPSSMVAMTAPEYRYDRFSDLTRITGYTGQQLEKALVGTGLEGLGARYAEKEHTHGINALFLIGVAKLESASGTSSLARNSNNLGGLKNGRNGYMSFASKSDCIEYMADLLSEKYLSENGKYFKGKTTKDISIRYCEQSTSWYGQVESLMKRSYEAIVS